MVVLGRWPRRVTALALLIAAALVGLHGPGEGRADGWPGSASRILAAARDLAAGTTLTAADVRPVTAPAALVPAGAVHSARQAVGRVVAGAMRRGEPLTDARLVGPGLAAGLAPPAVVAVPVRLADAQAAALLRAGDRVDILASAVGGVPLEPPPGTASGDGPEGPRTGPKKSPQPDAVSSAASGADVTGGPSMQDATVLAADVRVLAVLADANASATDGLLIVVAAAERTARRLTGASAQARLSVTLRPP